VHYQRTSMPIHSIEAVDPKRGLTMRACAIHENAQATARHKATKPSIICS
jgi:hypothetical protein